MQAAAKLAAEAEARSKQAAEDFAERMRLAEEQQRQWKRERLRALQKNQEEDARFSALMARLNNQLQSLFEEEVGLLARLAAGGLSAEEEREIRSRLKEITHIREGLLDELMQASIRHSEAQDARYVNGLAMLDQMLGSVSDEETDLLQMLEDGVLSATTEVAVRARLGEIEKQRAALLYEHKPSATAFHLWTVPTLKVCFLLTGWSRRRHSRISKLRMRLPVTRRGRAQWVVSIERCRNFTTRRAN